MDEWPDISLPTLRPGDTNDSLRQQVLSWLGSEPLTRLVQAFGGDRDDREGHDLANYLDDFASRHWDFRGGRERNLVSEIAFEPKRVELVLAAADSLGLRRARAPRMQRYDVVLVLGGLVRACVVRPRYVAALIREGLVVDEVVALGGFRPLAGDELGLAQRLGVLADDEYDAMTLGMEAAFEVPTQWDEEKHESGIRNGDWMVRTQKREPTTLRVIAAPSTQPTLRRANTPDTYRFYADRRAQPTTRPNVLLVTNQIYVPYQGCAALEVLGLGYGWSVETVGADQRAGDLGDDSQEFGPQQYLQEMRSAIFGMRSLLAAISARDQSL